MALTPYTCLLQFAVVLTVGQIISHAVFLYLYIRIFLYFVFVIVLTCTYTLTDHFPLCGIQFAMDADFGTSLRLIWKASCLIGVDKLSDDPLLDRDHFH